jgi:hypothetical protein
MLKAHEVPTKVIAQLTVEMNNRALRHRSRLADTLAVDAVADSQKPPRRKAGPQRRHGYWKRFICKESSLDTFAHSGDGKDGPNAQELAEQPEACQI